MHRHQAELLLSRLRLSAPAARSFLITSARRTSAVTEVAHGLAGALEAVATGVTLVVPGDDEVPKVNGAGALIERLRPGDAEGAKTAIAETPGVVIVAAPAILERGLAITLASAVEAVVLVVKQGETVRADVPPAVSAVEEARGRLALVAYLT